MSESAPPPPLPSHGNPMMTLTLRWLSPMSRDSPQHSAHRLVAKEAETHHIYPFHLWTNLSPPPLSLSQVSGMDESIPGRTSLHPARSIRRGLVGALNRLMSQNMKMFCFFCGGSWAWPARKGLLWRSIHMANLLDDFSLSLQFTGEPELLQGLNQL